MKKYTFPAVFAQDGEAFSVSFPDLPSVLTSGQNLAEAIEMAEDALCLMLHDMEINGWPVPSPSALESIKTKKNEFAQYVVTDTKFYHDYFANLSVRKNVTIPSYLNALAEKQRVNFSSVLQDALREHLGVNVV